MEFSIDSDQKKQVINDKLTFHRHVSRSVVPRHEARLWRESECSVWFGKSLQTVKARQGFLDVSEERGRWRGSGTDTRTDRQKGSSCW